MIKRIGYVSNSSTSSYIIAYDESVFGRLEECFQDENMGEMTRAVLLDENKLAECCFRDKTKDRIRKAWGEGMKVFMVELEHEVMEGVEMLLENVGNNVGKSSGKKVFEYIRKCDKYVEPQEEQA